MPAVAASSDDVLRYDQRSALRPVRRLPDGRVRADAYIGRAGIQLYLNKDGSTRRELREPEEVFHRDALASFEQVPVTNNHPPKLLTSAEARDYMVGATGETVTRGDDDHIQTTLMIADATTIQQMEAGKVQTSAGYKCRIDNTGGVHPVYGPYDVRQYQIRGNHVAIVDTARAGEKSAARMDSGEIEDRQCVGVDESTERADAVWVTSIDDGHAHVIEPSSVSPGGVGYTSYGTTSDGEHHAHAWITETDGSTTILDNTGHGHTIDRASTGATTTTPASPAESDAPAARGDAVTCTPAIIVHSGATMAASKNQTNSEQLLATAATQLAAASERASTAEAHASAETARADAAEGEIASLKAQLKSSQESRIDAVDVERRDATIHTLQKQLGETKAKLSQAEDPSRLRAAVTARVKLETAAGAVLGETKMDGFSDRELMDTVIEKLLGKKTDVERSDDYARACFDTAVNGHFGGQDALAALRAASQPRHDNTDRADAKSARQAMIERTRNASKPRSGEENK